MYRTLGVVKFVRSIEVMELQPLNIPFICVADALFQFFRFRDFKEEQSSNMLDICHALEVFQEV